MAYCPPATGLISLAIAASRSKRPPALVTAAVVGWLACAPSVGVAGSAVGGTVGAKVSRVGSSVGLAVGAFTDSGTSVLRSGVGGSVAVAGASVAVTTITAGVCVGRPATDAPLKPITLVMRPISTKTTAQPKPMMPPMNSHCQADPPERRPLRDP